MYSCWPILTLAALALPAHAQDLLDRLPPCALNCSSHFFEQISCSATDKTCLCTDTEILITGISACAGASCRVRDVLSSTNTTIHYCDIRAQDSTLTIEIITGVFGILALLVVLLRMVTRMRPFKATFGWDDGLIISVMATATTISINQFICTNLGFGRDIFTVHPHDIGTMLKFWYAGELLYDYSISVTKLSVLCFYLRIFANPSFKRSTYILMGVCTAYLAATIPATIWQCTPISYMWTSWSGETQGHCINVFLLTWIATAVNILLDIAVILLPIPQLLKLTLSRRKKIQIIAMFCVGLFVTLTSVLRLQSLIQFKATTNFTWDYRAVAYLSLLEIDVGIICACMPAMKLLLRRFVPRLFGSTVDAGSYLHPHTGSRTKSHRNTNSHHTQSKNSITKTIATTVIGMPKDTESVIELVNASRATSVECGSFATVVTETAQEV